MRGLIQLDCPAASLDGDVVLVDPGADRAERMLRAGSRHNSLLVTERCDQLCTMCSQPPKKTHTDRFALLTEACLLAERDAVIGITGGEPTLFKHALLGMIETVLSERPDLRFHVLSNGQHFERGDIERLRAPHYRRVVWGIPLYADDADLHDRIVGKAGAFERLHDSFDHLLLAGARVELRTVLLANALDRLPYLARHVVVLLSHVEQWSLMGLENIGFARSRWAKLYVDLRTQFGPLGEALDIATLHGLPARLFNLPLCHVPSAFRHHAVASISDWKQRFAAGCASCRARSDCSGFFEWHPAHLLDEVEPL
ncbi:His-Xaa-Ser system radical SAM maturase HxsC [Sphingomonas gilva]|uniref:His-Xaa-Ser system radical SAM maturase HxsC n=1 Tax=Sphingomonas gilva TaxID=2305907 RepID=UPI001FE99016|nr:His-Xaa-Ser system radical SAM maturase HxsC [Sphingomonas gilva]